MANHAGIIHQEGSIRYLDRRMKGAPVGILVFFLINPGLTFDDGDLRFYTGYSAPTLRAALGSLARLGVVAQLGDRKVWALTAHLRQLDFSGVAEGINSLGGEEKSFFPIASSSIDLDPKADDLLLTSSPGEKNFSPTPTAPEPDPALVDTLTGAGIFPDLAAELAGDPWVTEARITAWLERLRADRTVRSIPAVLATSLKRHLEAGSMPAPKEKRRPWQSGYLCPECHAAPCLCDETRG